MIVNTPLVIHPDNLKDTIVELRYDGGIPFEILLGFVYRALDSSYFFTNRPPITNQAKRTVLTGDTVQIELPQGQKIFFNDKIKLELRPNSFVFNCLDKYIGWKEYYAEIERALSQILQVEEIQNIKRIGIRYISEYVNENIDSITQFNFAFGIPEIKSNTYLFRTEFEWLTKERVILNLKHNAPSIVPKDNNSFEQSSENVYVIDVDVISDNLNLLGISDILAEINRVHEIEKKIFFTVLKPEYLKILNPVYE